MKQLLQASPLHTHILQENRRMRVAIYLVLPIATLISASLSAEPAGPAILRADGLGPDAAIVRFGTAKAAALQRLSSVLGRPLSQRTIADCGQGEPMSEVTFRGKLVLTFFHGKFSGWSLDSKSFVTTTGLGIGSPRAAIAKSYPGMTVDHGPLGVMFESEKGVSGFLDADRPQAHVIGLYAGETCMVS